MKPSVVYLESICDFHLMKHVSFVLKVCAIRIWIRIFGLPSRLAGHVNDENR